MSTLFRFKPSPLSLAIKVPTLTLLLAGAMPAQALPQIVNPGDTYTIEAGDPTHDWMVLLGANLIVNGASAGSISSSGAAITVNTGSTVGPIRAQDGSTVDLAGAEVTATAPGSVAMELTNGTATIASSRIQSSSSIGLMLNRAAGSLGGSRADVFGSEIYGALAGASVSQLSELHLTDSWVQGTAMGSTGLLLAHGAAFAEGSTLIGEQNGVRMTGVAGSTGGASLVLDGSTVQGESGAAIVVAGAPGRDPQATIQVNNGSRLIGGNGNLLEVTGSATANMTVDNSHLQGDVIVEAGSTANLSLQNRSSLIGALLNVNDLSIGDQSSWTLTGNSLVGAMTLAGGTVKFGESDAFYQLNADSLSGNGTFIMGADFARGLNDFLNIAGNASGNHDVLIAASGTEPVSPGDVHIVHTGGGDAQFALLGGSVDIGAWSYGLKQVGNDWFLDPNQRVISPGTRSVLGLFNATPTAWYGEATSLRTRMGELRHNDGQAGGWIRSYGNKYAVEGANGVGYKQLQHGFSLGADTSLNNGTPWLVGVMAGHSTSDLDMARGTTGTIKSYYAGLYATWLDTDTGFYFDGVIKANRFESSAKVGLSDGSQAKGSYGTNAVGVSAEIGQHLKLDNDLFVEPFAQASAVAVGGKDYRLDNGMQAKGQNTHSLQGKAGVTVGLDIVLDDGSLVQPYLRTALVHEFAKNNQVSINNHKFDNDLSGSRVDFGAGVAVSLSQHLQLHADFEHAKGERVDQPWGANVGVRYSF